MSESMGPVREALASTLNLLVGLPCERTLATTSLKFRFDCREDPRGRAYVWIDPPWRLTFRGAVVTGSADCPVWEEAEEEEVNQPIWHAWCALFDPLTGATLAEASVGVDYPDLSLRFTSGHVIQTFGNSRGGCWWYYRDRLTGEVFEAGAGGIVHEFAEPAAP